jgi:hypothetical protein
VTEHQADPDDPATVGRALVTEIRTQSVLLLQVRRALVVLAVVGAG